MDPLGRDQVLALLAAPRGNTPPLYGRQVGDIDLAGHTFDGDADFRGARFARGAHFEGTVFRGAASFSGAVFAGGAYFLAAEFERGGVFSKAAFHQGADFSNSRFADRAYFWRARFRGPADFLNLVVDTAKDAPRGRIFPGEANFSWAWFTGKATFTRAHFHGPVYFWRTLFGSDTLFDSTLFEGKAVFNGTRTEVQLSRHEFSNPALLDELAGRGLLRHDPEEQIVVKDQEGKDQKLTVFFEFAGVSSDRELADKLAALAGVQVSPRERAELERVWEEGSKEMFAVPRGVTFDGAEFKNPDEVEAIQVNVHVPIRPPGNPLDAIDIKPGAYGVSVDVKKLFRTLWAWCGRLYRRLRGRQ
jgi:uncharacterized protein YjbI with pentapeptide repeats